MADPTFFVEGPVGSYKEANNIAKNIEEFLQTNEGTKYAK